jgi:hypothetical protein
LTSHHLTWGKRDFGHGDGIAPVSVLLAVSYPRNSGTGFATRDALKDYLKDRLWSPLDGGIGLIATKRRAGRVSLSMSRHPTGDKQGFRIADDLT